MAGGYDVRTNALEKVYSAIGASVLDVAFTLGEFDIIVSVGFPREDVALGTLVAVQSREMFWKLIVLTELDLDAIVGHANMARPAYAAAALNSTYHMKHAPFIYCKLANFNKC